LVNRFNLLVSESRFIEGIEFKKLIRTKDVEGGAEKNEGYEIYNDYRDLPVIGVYRWIPEIEICLIAKMDQKEAYGPIDRLTSMIIAISIIVVFFVFILAYFFSRTITNPVYKMVEASQEIAEGNLDKKVDVTSKDEIGQLGEAFNVMTQKLKESYEGLEKSGRKYRSLFNDALDMIHIVDRNGRIADANKIELETLGYSMEELIGKPLLEIIHPDYRIVTKEALDQILKGEKVKFYETAFVTKKGKKIII